MCFTHFVSGGSSTGGSARVSSSRTVSGAAGSRCTLRTSLTRLPGDLLNCCPSHWSSCSQRVCPSVRWNRSEEHTSELQSQSNLVCRLLLEKKKSTYSLGPPHMYFVW